MSLLQKCFMSLPEDVAEVDLSQGILGSDGCECENTLSDNNVYKCLSVTSTDNVFLVTPSDVGMRVGYTYKFYFVYNKNYEGTLVLSVYENGVGVRDDALIETSEPVSQYLPEDLSISTITYTLDASDMYYMVVNGNSEKQLYLFALGYEVIPNSPHDFLNSIADGIREKTGRTDVLSLAKMDAAITKVFDAGKQAEYDRFWNGYQRRGGGTRKNYLCAFAGTYWDDETYNPKYPIVASENLTQAFYYARMSSTKVTIDLSDAVRNFNNAFGYSKIETIPKIIFSERNAEATSTLNAMFTGCEYLENITVEGVIPLSISFQWSTRLTHDSLMSIINALADKSADTSGKEYTLTIGSENLAKLTEAELAIAYNKGWRVF